MTSEAELIQEIAIGAPFMPVALHLEKCLRTVLRDGQGFLVKLTDRPAGFPNMRAHAKGGPDNYEPLPPLARDAYLEAWHEDFKGRFFRCIRARLRAAPGQKNGSDGGGESCRLAWDTEEIRIDVQSAWQDLLELAANFWSLEPEGIKLPGNGPYLPPIMLQERSFYTNFATLDAATKTVFNSGFAPGFVRYERLAEKHADDFVRYHIKDNYHGGGWGEIWLRMAGPEWTLACLCALELRPAALPVEIHGILTLPVEEQPPAAGRLAARIGAEWEANLRAKKAYLEEIWDHYCNSMPPQWLSPKRRNAAEALAQATNVLSERDTRMVSLWQQGYTAEEIGRLLCLSSGHIRNEISRLRKELGEEEVPLRK